MSPVDKSEIVCFDCGLKHKANLLEDAGCVHAIAPVSWLTVSWTQENDAGAGTYLTAETIYFCETCKRSAFERFNGKRGKQIVFSGKLIEIRFGMPASTDDIAGDLDALVKKLEGVFKQVFTMGPAETRNELRRSVKKLVEGLDAVVKDEASPS